MRKRLVACAVVLVLATLALPAVAQAGGHGATPRGGGVGIRAGVTCHDPCDDPFQVKAWVNGSNVKGLVVKFSVKGKVFSARTDSSGFAHVHLKVRPSTYPHGVLVKVTASVTHGGVTTSSSAWFKPNYS
jgi:hypothetical protein